MRDFTLKIYAELLDALILGAYEFQTFRDYLIAPKKRVVILRHDVDKRPGNALKTAIIEHERALKASYYFRIVPESLDANILLQIKKLGHEIGYHYEDMDPAKGDKSQAILSFEKNLNRLRKLASIETICMHGSPLSKYDNKDLWQDYAYQDFGIIGEPYFDLDYNEIFYITDTGRRWNNRDASLRDKVDSNFDINVQNTRHFIELIQGGNMPNGIIINTHPQRWDDGILAWGKELIWQNVKNWVKKMMVSKGV